ncbi:hypothetical protein FC678_17700 [Peribacillus simplex]|uniref:Uncharacterized protein n=1 Tax=Peribacillus simplex TaxID=1478 RepID=A0A9X9ERP9_9BACI|nr:hypothetical protein [Peribacillus simplex]TKH09312.1 hypothetical protein FC678_17700 [Peribacillus simplex]
MEHEEMLFYLKMVFIVVGGIGSFIVSIIGPFVFKMLCEGWKKRKKKSKERELRGISTPNVLGANCIRHTNQHSQPDGNGMQTIIIEIEVVIDENGVIYEGKALTSLKLGPIEKGIIPEATPLGA